MQKVTLISLSKKIDGINESIAKTVAYLNIAMVITTFVITTLRYIFKVGFIGMQESVIYMHAVCFLMASAYALRRNFHVRVDVFYSFQNSKRKALIDLFGITFLLFPTAFFWGIIAVPYVFDSWLYLEVSREAGGLPLVFILKTFIIIAPILLILQGAADFIRNALFLRGHISEEEWK